MAEPYLTVLKSIVERSCPPHEEVGDVACKHFFSGAAAYANGHIFMTLTSVGLALKLPEDDRTTLLAEGATLLSGNNSIGAWKTPKISAPAWLELVTA